MSEKRLPNYDLSILDKDYGKKGKVGAGWLNQDGSISIQLNFGVVLSSYENLVINLFPRDASKRRSEVRDEDVPY